jgi:hypothetical protein
VTGNGHMLSDSIPLLRDNLKGCYANDQVVTQVNAPIARQSSSKSDDLVKSIEVDESLFHGRSQHHRAERQSVVQCGLKDDDTSGV